MIPEFEAGNTVQFTWVSSVAPDSAPTFSVKGGIGNTLINSFTATQSDSTHYYALVTMPNSGEVYLRGEWRALKTFAGSAYQFLKRFQYKTIETNPID